MDRPGGHREPRARKKLYAGFASTFDLVLMKAPQRKREKCRVDSEIQDVGAPLSEHRPTPGGKMTLLACAVNQSPLKLDLHVLHHDPVVPDSRCASKDSPFSWQHSEPFLEVGFLRQNRRGAAAPGPRRSGRSLLVLPTPDASCSRAPEAGMRQRAMLENAGVRNAGKNGNYERVLLTQFKMWAARSCGRF